MPKHLALDFGAALLVLNGLWEIMPKIAILCGMIFYGIEIWESNTFKPIRMNLGAKR